MPDATTPNSGDANDLCTQATFQIEAMCHALRNAAVASDTDNLPYLVQGIVQRIIDLNGAMMYLFTSEENDALEDLRLSVCGSVVESREVNCHA